MPDAPKPKLRIVDGLIVDPRVRVALCPLLDRGPLKSVIGIIVHQTGGSTAAGTLSEYRNPLGRGLGAHFLLDRDGTMYQTVQVNHKAYHVGRLRARCVAELTCKDAKRGPKSTNAIEDKKPYPKRYPANYDSIGIEVVGKSYGPDPARQLFDPPTPQQNDYMHWFVDALLEALDLDVTDVYKHPLVSIKQDNEAVDVTW